MRPMHRVAALLSACVLALGLVIAGPAAAQAAVTPPTGFGWAELFLPRLSNTDCLDVPSGSRTPGTNLQIFHCHGYASNGAPQRWTFAALFSGGYEIYNPSTLLCITPTAGNAGARVVEQTCGGFAGQGWNLVDDPRAPGVLFELVNVTVPTMCLYGGHGNNAAIVIAGCSAADDDTWALG